MNLWRLAWHGVWHHRRVQLGVVAAVAVATAVLTGALLVGDSMRGSLMALTLDRLGRIDFAVINDRFFRAELADELGATPGFDEHFAAVAPVAVLPSVTVEVLSPDGSRLKEQGRAVGRARGVTLIGCDQRFWALDANQALEAPELTEQNIWLNASLAQQLGAQVGDRLVLRLPQADDVPADSPLGKKDGRVRNLANLLVSAVLPDQGLARFQLQPSQARSLNVFVPLETLQEALDVEGRANAMLIATRQEGHLHDPKLDAFLRNSLAPRLRDYGIRIDHVQKTYELEGGAGESQPKIAFAYSHLVNDRLMWSEAAREAALEALADDAPQEMFTYLANSISTVAPGDARRGDQNTIPYSTLVAVDSTSPLGPLLDDKQRPIRLADNEIVLNSWSADDLNAQVGDAIWVSYFAAETTHGIAEERTKEFVLAGVAELTSPRTPFRRGRPATFDRAPTLVTDEHLTPEVKGVTDQASIADWDPPFPFDQRRIRPQDDEYWEDHRTTPKAFISLAAGKQLWSSRFGETTGFRVAANVDVNRMETSLRAALRKRNADLGFSIIPIKRTAIDAAAGTTSFAGLFLGFSFFLIVAALLLLVILFRLAADLRKHDLGLLAALGWRPKDSAGVLMREATIVSVTGVLLGLVGGAAYAALMLSGLRTWWVAAIVTPFVKFMPTITSLVVGAALSLLTCLVVMWLSLRQLMRLAPRALMAGSALELVDRSKTGAHRRLGVGLLLLLAFLAGVLATRLTAEAQAGAFFGSGLLVLVAGLLWVRGSLSFGDLGRRSVSDLPAMARSSLSRNPGRTMMAVGLIAAACFMIVAISAFRLKPTEAGTGGFVWVAETDQPLFVDFQDPASIRKAVGQAHQDFLEAKILGFRAESGSDASCRNLYQASRPRMLGVSQWAAESSLKEASFAWAGRVTEHAENPWLALFDRTETKAPAAADDEQTIPVILDKNTAMYSLHAGARIGAEFTMEDPDGRSYTFRTVGLLSNSILQGRLLVADDQLVRLFPENAGQRYFLISGEKAAAANGALSERFGDEGWAGRQTEIVLADLLAIQNTYLSTFQSLGGLGLLLGTIGLACVQLRNVMERRRELGMMRAIGFGDQQIRELVFRESAMILMAGLLVGCIAALVTTIPHMIWGAATLPWSSTLATLLAILACGLIASAIAVRAALRTPLLSALRGD